MARDKSCAAPRPPDRIVRFDDQKGFTYLHGDAAQAYAGRLLRCDRHILFLRPGVFLVLDDLMAPKPSRFQWLLHAFERMDLGDQRIISRRQGATLEVRLRCQQGLALSQTDQFDTPYNEGIPESFQRDVANHWHATAETEKTAVEVRIGAVMTVVGPEVEHGQRKLCGRTAAGELFSR